MTDTSGQWTETGRSEAFRHNRRAIDKVAFTDPAGRSREIFLRNENSAAAVVALTDDGEIVVAQQFRLGPMGVLHELPGGYVEDGEDPLAAGVRELLEETGYEGEAEYVGWCWDDAASNAKRHCVVVRGARRTAGQKLDDGEFVTVTTMPVKEFLEKVVRRGLMTDVEIAYRGLDHLGLL